MKQYLTCETIRKANIITIHGKQVKRKVITLFILDGTLYGETRLNNTCVLVRCDSGYWHELDTQEENEAMA